MPAAHSATGRPPAGVRIAWRSAAKSRIGIRVTSQMAINAIVTVVDQGSASATATAKRSAHHAHFSGSLILATIRRDQAVHKLRLRSAVLGSSRSRGDIGAEPIDEAADSLLDRCLRPESDGALEIGDIRVGL